MGTLGKILLFVNLLAAGGLVYLTTQDWAKRQEVTAMALRYHLVLKGLPVEGPAADDDDVPLRVEVSGGITTETVGPKFLTSYFGDAGSTSSIGGATKQPASQVEEVKRVQEKLRSLIKDPVIDLCGRFDKVDGVTIFTPGHLARMAESYEQRELIRQMAVAPDQQRAAADAQAMMDRRFAAVINAPNPKLADEEAVKMAEVSAAVKKSSSDIRKAFATYQANPTDDAARRALNDAQAAAAKPYTDLREFLANVGTAASRDDADRRRRAAFLLSHLNPDEKWQKRVVLVVGFRTYASMVADHVNKLKGIAESTNAQIIIDQGKYSEEYEMLKTLAVDRSLLLEKQTKITADLRTQRAKDDEAAKQRYAQLVDRKKELDAVRAEVAVAISRQEAVEKGLFGVQQQVGETLRRNFDLEDKLGAAEGKASGGKN